MATIPFSHLHVHTDSSPKDGLGPVSHLVQVASARGFKHLALTDHGTLGNAIAFSLEAKSQGVKPLIGLEGYVQVDGEAGHLTLLANGNKGFANLVRLNNLGHASENKQPAFTIDQLLAHADGLVLLSGCVASPLNKMPLHDAIRLGARLKSAFGSRMFAEVMFVADIDTHSRPLVLAEKLGIKPVITNDSHFATANEAPVHPMLTSIKAGYTYNSAQLYLKTAEEIMKRARRFMSEADAIDAFERTFKIGETLKQVEFAHSPHLPTVENAAERLEALVIPAAKKLGKEYVTRVRYELSIINDMGYATYFMILKDIIDYAHNHEILVGPGRGSGAGSLVLYLLNCTDIDPLIYDLPFERFLTRERVGMPDVDTDFDSEKRDEILEYAKKKWNAIPIATYARYSHKTLVHDLCKYLRIPRGIDEAAADDGPESEAFKDLMKNEMFGLAYNSMLGQIRHKGTHASGVIITDQDVPIERTGHELAASWTEGLHNELTYAGIVKFDLLGLSALAILSRLEKRLGVKAPDPVPNAPEFALFRKGKLDGIFQFTGSSGILQLTKKLAPTEFKDLIAINALYRPGALDVGATDKFPEWKKNPRKVHPLIEPILRETYGAIVYQEQVMRIVAALTGGTLGAADEARRIIVKSKEKDAAWVAKIMALREVFIKGAMKRGMKEKEASDLWEELAAHSRYSFNKAHATAYAMIAWRMAWWKFNYPAYFYAEMLNVDSTEAQTYLMAAAEDGIIIHPPKVNTSGTEYLTKTGKEIYMPLTSIKFLSLAAANHIIEAREKGGAFTSGEDFMKRTLKKVVRGQARLGMLALGAFQGLPVTPKVLGVKEDMPTFDSEAGSQREHLGFIIPTREIVRKVNAAKKQGKVAGIIAHIEEKTSKWGPYHVFKLTPTGAFWCRGLTITKTLKIGDIVAATTRKDSGKATHITVL